MFSPYFAWSRRRGRADPSDHCALNVALYGGDAARWSMTERGRRSLQRSANALVIGPSALRWDGSALTFDIDEVTAPWPRRIRGRVRVIPRALNVRDFAIDASMRHRWTPIAPASRIEVELEAPCLRWSGDAYLDSNHGDEPLVERLREWQWSRAHLGDGTAVIYDVTDRAGARSTLALHFGLDGAIRTFDPPDRVRLPRTRWGIARTMRSEKPSASVDRTLEDTPFYARSLVVGELFGHAATAMHESLDLDRLRSPIVQAMLPFRMPRRARRT